MKRSGCCPRRPPRLLEEGHRHADRGLQDHRVLRRHGVRRSNEEWLFKTYKPTTPSRRHMTVSAFEGIDKKAKPERSLTEIVKKNSGRNSYGRITVRHRGGGNKQQVSYHRLQARQGRRGCHGRSAWSTIPTVPPTSLSSSMRTATRRYILAPVGLKVGDKVDVRPPTPTSSPATACLSPTSPWVPSSTASSCIPARAASWSAPPASRRS